MSVPLTPEQFAALPHNDAGPTLLIVIWTLSAFATLFMGLRIYCKLIGHRSFFWDDWILIAAWVTLMVDDGLATFQVKGFGYGKHSWDLPASFNLDDFYIVITTRATFTVTAIAWTKTAFAVTLLRLTTGRIKAFVWFIIISMNILLGVSALLFWVQCKPIRKSWKPTVSGTCMDGNTLMNYAIASSAYSAIMDFILALLPWKVIWELKMKRVEKLGVAIAMSMGIFAGIVAIVKCVKLPKLASPDLYDAADLVMWDIIEAAVTMMAACIPILRILFRDIHNSTRRYHASGQSPPVQLQSGEILSHETFETRETMSPVSFETQKSNGVSSKPSDESIQYMDFRSDRSVLYM